RPPTACPDLRACPPAPSERTLPWSVAELPGRREERKKNPCHRGNFRVAMRMLRSGCMKLIFYINFLIFGEERKQACWKWEGDFFVLSPSKGETKRHHNHHRIPPHALHGK